MNPSRTLPWLLIVLLLGAILGRWSAPSPVQAQAAASNNRFAAVAAEYQTGVSLLYVLDSETGRLAVYEARGGAKSSQRVSLVGVRNISLDLQLDGFNDESEYRYDDLKDIFEERRIGTSD